jgi:hypothetical protein
MATNNVYLKGNFVMSQSIKRIVISTVLVFAILGSQTGCGTMTGIPSHGGGKRFAIEQRLVSASIRSTLMDIDVTSLRGQKVAIVFDLISDEGGGSLSGGRLNFLAGMTSGYVVSPVNSTNSQFQIFNLTDTGTNTQNQTSNGTQTGASTSTGTGTQTSTGTTTSTGTGTTAGTNTNTGTGTGTTTTTTGAVTTNQTDNNTNTSTGTSTGTSTSAGTQTSTGNTTSTSAGTGTTTGNSTATSNSTGSNTTNRQVVSPTASSSQSQNKGSIKNESASLEYKGLGEYQNFNVPKSDATLLMGLVRNYLILNGVKPTTPSDETATAILYVTVDIFGLVRSRFDMYIYNQENVRAETAIEMMAFDRNGKMIMKPQSANREAKYDENYFFWAGPFKTEEEVRKGKGLLVDFSSVDGLQKTYPADTQRFRWEGNSR